MSEQERRRVNRNQNSRGPSPQSSGNDGGELETRRQQGHNLLRAGDSIIRGVLSGNSQTFLTISEQQGGQ